MSLVKETSTTALKIKWKKWLFFIENLFLKTEQKYRYVRGPIQDIAKCPRVRTKTSVSFLRIKNIRDLPIRIDIATIMSPSKMLDVLLSNFRKKR
jgi:hypothetical protein